MKLFDMNMQPGDTWASEAQVKGLVFRVTVSNPTEKPLRIRIQVPLVTKRLLK